MAQKYIILKEENEGLGLIAINKSVFYAITELSIDEIENAVRIPKTRLNKPLTIKTNDNKLDILVDVKIKYLAEVEQTCELIQNKIFENILHMTGFKANDVQVNVVGFEI